MVNQSLYLAKRVGRLSNALTVLAWIWAAAGIVGGILIATIKVNGACTGTGYFDYCDPSRHPYIAAGVGAAFSSIVFGVIILAIASYIALRADEAIKAGASE